MVFPTIRTPSAYSFFIFIDESSDYLDMAVEWRHATPGYLLYIYLITRDTSVLITRPLGSLSSATRVSEFFFSDNVKDTSTDGQCGYESISMPQFEPLLVKLTAELSRLGRWQFWTPELMFYNIAILQLFRWASIYKMSWISLYGIVLRHVLHRYANIYPHMQIYAARDLHFVSTPCSCLTHPWDMCRNTKMLSLKSISFFGNK